MFTTQEIHRIMKPLEQLLEMAGEREVTIAFNRGSNPVEVEVSGDPQIDEGNIVGFGAAHVPVNAVKEAIRNLRDFIEGPNIIATVPGPLLEDPDDAAVPGED